MERYKADYNLLLKEALTLLELALWKAKLDVEKEGDSLKGDKAKVDTDSVRKVRRVKCGADIIIRNVLPILQLE
jgi:hypothetical protein